MSRRTALCLLVLAVFCAGVHGQLVFARNPPLWDAAEYYLPCRLFLSDCLRHGLLPVWNPYCLQGYPFAADPQSAVFYPVAWIIGGLRRYDLLSYGLEHGVTLYAAAVGAFLLARRFTPSRGAAVLAACCYAGCGAFTSNAEHLAWLIAAAWMPWVFWSYLKMLETARASWALLAAGALYLLLTGGYPGFTIVVGYVLVGCSVVAVLRRRQPFRSLAGAHLLLLAGFGLLALVPLCVWGQALPYITRGGGLTVEKAVSNPFTPHAFLSFLLPLSTLKNDAFFGTDISMRNAYAGLTALLLAGATLRAVVRPLPNRVLLLLLALFLACAVGAATPLRALLYHTLPGMNLFRFPALFRFFALLPLALLLGTAYAALVGDWPRARRALVPVAGGGVLLFAGILGRSWALHGPLFALFLKPGPFAAHLAAASFSACVQLQALLQLLLAAALLGIGRWVAAASAARALLLGCVLADLLLAAQLNVPGTVAYPFPAAGIEARIDGYPRAFAPPSLQVPLAQTADSRRGDLWPLHRNTGVYLHTVAPDGYNPFLLRTTAEADDRPAQRDAAGSRPLAFLAGLPGIVGSDTAAGAGTRLSMPEFRPGSARLEVAAPAAAVVTLQQSPYPGWGATLDGRPVPILDTARNHLSVAVPGGRHTVRFAFRVPLLRWLPVGWALFGGLALLVGGRAIAARRQRLRE